MAGERILIVDDDAALARVAARNLENEGFATLTASDGQEGLRLVFEQRPNLVLLDIMMPGLDGYEICRRIREATDVPIVMLTARNREEDIIRGLELGADDYIVKPFRAGEFLARVRAALRRGQLNLAGVDALQDYEDGWLNINIPTRTVIVQGQPASLSATEFNLLALLLQNWGRIVESDEILRSVWGPEYLDEIAYVRVYISHLRQKIEPDPAQPTYIQTERQVGYRFIRQDAG